MNVSLLDLKPQYAQYKDKVIPEIMEVIENQAFILGFKVEKMEKELAEYTGAKYALGVSSGTDALLIALMSLGIGHGDEVITTPYTFFATAGSIHRVGARPVFVDIDPDTYNIDPSKIEKAISKRTKAIMPVHLYGQCCDLDAIMSIAKKHDLKVIEDACQSLGATFRGKKTGSFGLTGCWSFYPFKILGGYGDGGAITTNDAKVERYAKLLRYNGEKKETGAYYYHGFTCLLDNIQAAFLAVKLRHLPEWLRRRRKIADIYRKGLSGIEGLKLPHFEDKRFGDVFQNYVVRTSRRDELYNHLKKNGVEILIHWRIPYYKYKGLKLKTGRFSETESISREVLSLPMNVEITDAQVKYVIKTICNFFQFM